MKKSYETPTVEKIAFRYRDQVVAASGELSFGTGSDSGSDNGSNSWNSNPGSECYKYSHQKNGAKVCYPS